MQLGKEDPTAERNAALYSLLTSTRSFELLRERCALPTNEFDENRREEIDVARHHQAQTGSGARLLERCWTSLAATDAAFERLRRGQYGLCEDCGNEISLERLKVAPLTPYCFECLQERERKPAPEANNQNNPNRLPTQHRPRRIGKDRSEHNGNRSRTGPDTSMAIMVVRFAIAAAFIVMPVVYFSTPLMYADEPIEVDSPAGEGPPSQVLELPQNCTLDGTPIACDNPERDIAAADSGASAEAASVQSAEQSAGANANAAVANAPKSPDSDDADQTADADWGTAQNYQNQGEMTGPMISTAVPFDAGTLPNEAYVRPHIFVAAPVPIGPFVSTAGPLLPQAIVARGPIRGFHFRRFR
jgi:RNA polymerase-binding transcription factor DksA